MTFENNFIDHSKEYIFLDNDILIKHREKAYNKIVQKDYDKKNNESLKNITISDISNFDYFYKPKTVDPKVSLVDKLNYKIEIINGICKNYEDDNIEIRNLTKIDYKKFLDQDNNSLDDIIIDFNKVFLNSGIFFNIKSDTKIGRASCRERV